MVSQPVKKQKKTAASLHLNLFSRIEINKKQTVIIIVFSSTILEKKKRIYLCKLQFLEIIILLFIRHCDHINLSILCSSSLFFFLVIFFSIQCQIVDCR
ncbi:uncharacterized protein EV154DRAFT_494875 [Mucor mucedo]|uniref:uncharacterized protein n=1 Tax=Mucor mucedo TaxID=29922 RepID=UPI00221FEC7D|nr:uncharacterized protein EV154DRAFT_494875 [Mucor mucedo]KAI7895770.1 hypothetical protein EV154DRAFT_494875 [Mucor mucedo]